MNRYRTLGQLDDASINEGDTSLIGVNSYDSPENLQPGECAAATNMDFTSQDAKTRGGLVCLPELGATPFTNQWIPATAAAADSYVSVVYAAGIFVAVGLASGSYGVMTSTDGISWIARTESTSKTWLCITYGAGLFVAVANDNVGTSLVMTSPDGITWTTRTCPQSAWYSVCYGNGKFVAVSHLNITNCVMTSPDGITWTAQSVGTYQGWRGVTYGNGLFVAVGDGSAFVIISSDGINWTAYPVAASNSWVSVAYGNGLFVAVANTGTGNRVMTSPDGMTWTSRTSAADNNWNCIAFGNNTFVAVANTGLGNRVMTSSDGIHWIIGSSGEDNSWFGVTYGNQIFVAVGNSGAHRVQYLNNTSIFASGIYSDPNDVGSHWIAIVNANSVGFFAFGSTKRVITFPTGYLISQQATIVQANNLLFIFAGSSQSPIQWDGTWGGKFVVCPVSTLGAGYENIPFSNHGLYYQNRLWVVNGKDSVDASQNLDFANFNLLTAAFNLNVGTSDYVVCSYPFGNNSLVVFKNRSSYLLQNVDGALTDVTSTEITRQIGIIGINAVTAVGPDIIYMSSDRNVTSIRLNLKNETQAVTVPLSRDINPIMRRVNWTYGYKVSMGYWNNLLFVALPLDQATACNTIIVYNFITQQWYGEWNSSSAINLNIQNFVTANYLGQIRMHAVTEDGRIFVVNEGQNDISGATVAEISASLTTRAYPANNENRFTRRLYLDLSTNRPKFSITAYVEGASESSQEVTNQTYLRSASWLFSDTAYDLTNANDDYNRAFRQDYSTGPASVQCGTGFQPEMTQDYRLPIITRRNGRLQWLQITNSTGFISVNSVGFESRDGYRSSLTQVG